MTLERTPSAAPAPPRRALSLLILGLALAAWLVDLHTGATALGLFAWLTPALFAIAWLSPSQRKLVRGDAVRLGALVLVLALALALRSLYAEMRPLWWTCVRAAALDVAVVAPLVLLTRRLDAWLTPRLGASRRGRALAFLVAQVLPALIGLPIVLLAVEVHRAQGTSTEGERAFARPGERIAFAGAGGTRLVGLWFENPEARGAVLLVHGIGAEKAQFLPAVSALYQRGYHVLAYDQRNHGESGGSACTLGVVEKEDVRRAWDLLLARTRGASIPRLLFGISMGGAAAQGALPALSGVDGLILDSTFADVKVLARRRLPLGPLAAPLVRAVRPIGVLLTGHDVLAFEAAPIAARVPEHLPILILHARGDPLVPFTEAEALARLYPHATLVPLDGDYHASGFVFASERYEAALTGFVAKLDPR